MIDFLTMILSLSMTATLLFGAIRCLEKVKYSIYGVYLLEKAVCVFYLLPAVFIIFCGYRCFTDNMTVPLYTEDFLYVNYDGYLRSLLLLKYDKTMQLLSKATAIIWGVGFLITFVFDTIRSAVLLSSLLKRSKIVTGGILWNAMKEIRREVNFNRDVLLYLSDKVDVPFTTGIIKLKIVFPVIEYNKEEYYMLLKHELIHCKRHDVFMKFLVRFVQKIHWFNPTVYLFSCRFNQDCEYTCDMDVVVDYNKEQRLQYGELIIKMASERRPTPGFTIGFSDNNFKFIERRLQYIMKSKVRRGITMVATTSAFMVACPIIAYAAVFGVGQAESAVIRNYEERRSSEFNQGIQMNEQYMSDIYAGEGEYVGSLQVRGINQIDITVKSNGTSRFSPVSMNAGSSIRIFVSSDNSADSFRAGIIAPDGRKSYVTSVDGMVGKTFSISSSGSYTVYIEGRNGMGGNDIHITGTINVNY